MRKLDVFEKVIRLYDEIYLLVYEISPAAEDVTEREVLARYCRQYACVRILDAWGKAGALKKRSLPDGMAYLRGNDMQDDEDEAYDEYDSESSLIYQEERAAFGEAFFFSALAGTGWDIRICQTLSDYRQFDEKFLIKISGSIASHWNTLLDYNYWDEEEKEEQEYNEEKNFFEKLGIFPEDSFVNVEAMLFLFNKRVERMLHIMETDEQERRGEYGEKIARIRSCIVFDRYFPDVSQPDFSEKGWSYLSYAFGEAYSDRREQIGFHLVNFEAVLILVLLDEIAEEFLLDYDGRKAGGSNVQ